MIKSNGGIIGPDNVTTGGSFGSASGVFKLGEVTNLIKDSKWPTAGPGGFQVANSVRYNDGDSPRMYKTPSSAGNRKKFTISAWVKRGSNLGANSYIFDARVDGNDNAPFQFNTSDQIFFRTKVGGSSYYIQTNRVFRDVSAFYHLAIVYDNTLGTAGDRIQLWVNGVRETSFAGSSMPPQNTDTTVNNANVVQTVGSEGGGGSYFDGYISEFVLLDGTAASPVDTLGSFNSQTGIWVPKDVSGLTFGTNGFYLDFKDSANLGNDANGGTDLTEVNLTSLDQSTDTCSTNFSTMNPLRQPTANPATFSNGNLTVQTNTSSGYYGGRSTIGVSSGKWYFEAKLVSYSASTGMIGIQNVESYTPEMFSSGQGIFAGYSSTGLSYDTTGVIGVNNNFTSYGNTYAAGDIISVALNLEDNEVKFYKNGTVQNSGTAISITAGLTYVFAVDDGSSSRYCTWDCNFGSPSFAISSGNTDGNGFGNFEYAVPTGFFSLNTKNLAGNS